MASADIPKAVLYYSQKSTWSAVALLALEEKGYGTDELDSKLVDLTSGENYHLTFLRLNPKATVPTLVVPLQQTLSEDVQSRYKAITETKTIAEFLDKSRSAQSRTHTTSNAPAPVLTPATIAFMTTVNEVIDLLYSEAVNPDNLRYFNARDQGSLQKLAQEVLPLLVGKDKALSHFLQEAENGQIHASEKTKRFWLEKKEEVRALMDVLSLADTPGDELSPGDKSKRDIYFVTAQTTWETNLKRVLVQLDKAMIGPYVLGDEFSIADLHLAAWLATLAQLVGVTADEDGETVVGRVVGRVGGGIVLGKAKARAGTKLGEFWDGVRGRKSWKRVYGGGGLY